MVYQLDINEQVLRSFILCGSALVAKLLIMSTLTAKWRFQKGVFISPEDTGFRKKARVANNDEDVERVRRAHMNDIENIPVFFFSGILYILTNPNPFIAINLFRLYTVCRYLHTYVYAIHVIPQPTRAIVWGISYTINWYMALSTILAFI